MLTVVPTGSDSPRRSSLFSPPAPRIWVASRLVQVCVALRGLARVQAAVQKDSEMPLVSLHPARARRPVESVRRVSPRYVQFLPGSVHRGLPWRLRAAKPTRSRVGRRVNLAPDDEEPPR